MLKILHFKNWYLYTECQIIDTNNHTCHTIEIKNKCRPRSIADPTNQYFNVYVLDIDYVPEGGLPRVK